MHNKNEQGAAKSAAKPRGRPPKQGAAMSGAERAAAYRRRRRLRQLDGISLEQLSELPDALLLDKLGYYISRKDRTGVKAALKEIERRHGQAYLDDPAMCPLLKTPRGRKAST